MLNFVRPSFGRLSSVRLSFVRLSYVRMNFVSLIFGRLSFGYQSVGLCFELFDHDINKTLVVITTETNENLELFYLVPQLIISYYKDGSTIDQEAWKKSQRKDAYIFIGGICLIFLVLGLIVYFLI